MRLGLKRTKPKWHNKKLSARAALVQAGNKMLKDLGLPVTDRNLTLAIAQIVLSKRTVGRI